MAAVKQTPAPATPKCTPSRESGQGLAGKSNEHPVSIPLKTHEEANKIMRG